ncbi:Suppressor of tumorigenicity 14 protein [Thelohanellus kitauei]|uniref:Suppressor of tumorigenicity 14 protein n=1 Tax=Thelohanellus kitauei TaxID=669202 RepID=A0A0C2MTG4_THEKT|nr:Suppressor of tumorigenicity 14 protein [Thelohanellus kitauei]
MCPNKRCLNQIHRCDGVENCRDGSDELNCTKKCENRQLFCEIDNKCLSFDQICDGTKDCTDGKDEADCKHGTLMTIKVVPRCREGSFECLNQICISSQKVCDGINDCGDNSDEQDCISQLII